MAKKKPSDNTLRHVGELTKLRTMLEAYRGQNRELQGHMVRYAEAIGALFSTARPLLDRIHELWPNIGEKECDVDQRLQQAVVAFRRTVYGLIPKEKLDEAEEQHADHSTGPGYPEGAEGLTAAPDPDAVPDDQGADGVRADHDGDAADPVEPEAQEEPTADGRADGAEAPEEEGEASRRPVTMPHLGRKP